MFTDMVGYSTLVHRNELLGLELLKEHHAIVRRALGEFGGREIDTAGDGFVVEFSSAVTALECALRIQESFAGRNEASPPERRFKVRIGIHASDILLTDSGGKQGVYGDGVNLAARLQPLAPAGGICISRTVYDQVHGKIDRAIHFMGDTQLKGFDKPIRIYSVDLEAPPWFLRMRRRIRHNIHSRRVAIVAPALLALAPILWWLGRGPEARTTARGQERIAILPFETIGADESGHFTSDGLVNGLITGLSQKGLRVLAKDSVIEIQKARLRPKRVGEELNIGRLVTGRILQEGREFLINIAIIDTANEEVEWSKDFHTREQTIAKTQSEIASELRAHLVRYQAPSSSSRAPAAEPPANDAYLAYIRGQFYLAKRTRATLLKATAEFANAIKLDPKYAAPYAAMALVSNLQGWYGLTAPQDAQLNIVRYAKKALALDPSSTEALIALAEGKAYFEYDFKEADVLYRQAIELNERNATAHQWYAEILAYHGRFPEARREISKALEYDPLSLAAHAAQAMISYYERDYDLALKQLRTSLNLESGFMLTHYWLGRTWLAKNDPAKAIAALKKAVELNGDDEVAKGALGHALARAGRKDEARAVLKDLETFARDRTVSAYHLAVVHIGLDATAEALRLLERAVIERGGQTMSVLRDPRFDSLRENSDFQRIVKKLNLGAP